MNASTELAHPARRAMQSLAGIGLLKSLGLPERQTLERRCQWRIYDEGQELIHRETSSQDVFFIVSGRVRVVNYSTAGREVSFDDIGPGGVVGELAALDREPRSAFVVAKVTTVTASLPAASFRDLLVAHPLMALDLLCRLAEIVRTSDDRIMSLSTLGANNRIYSELLREAHDADPATCKRGTGAITIRPAPMHADIAARVNTARETVSRVLSDLAKAGIVERKRGALVVLDIAHLTRMVSDFQSP